jgi:putative PEP-CTERM system TPR-repeat lipoprotein
MLSTRWLPGLVAALCLLAAACTPSPDELLADAQTAMAAGELRTAEIHLKNLLQQDARHVVARALLGRVSLAQGDFAGAERDLKEALALDATQTAVVLPLIQALLRQGKFAEALEQIAGYAPASDTERAALRSAEGTAQRGLGAFAEAEAAYKAAIEIEPASPVSRTDLAALYAAQGRIAEARAGVEAVRAEQPEFVPALMLLGGLEFAAARYDAAETLFKEVLRLEDSRRQGQAYALALAQLADSQLARGDLPSATASVDLLLTLQPASPIARYQKARIETQNGDLDAAERRLEQVVADVQGFTQAYVLLGIINSRQNQLGQAEMYLSRAQSQNPNDARAKLLLAEVLIKQDDLGGARNVIDQSGAAGSSLFLALAGRASLEAGQPALAAEYFARSEQIKPANLRDLIEIANVYVAAGELDRAIRMIEGASLTETESGPVANYLLALVHLRRGDVNAASAAAEQLTDGSVSSLSLQGTVALAGRDLDRAQETFQKILAADPGNVQALVNLARVAAARNDNPGAAGYLRQIVEKDPAQINAIFGLVQLAAQRGDFADAEAWLARAPESALRFSRAGELYLAQKRFDDAAAEFKRAFELQPIGALALQRYAAARAAGHENPQAILLDWVAEHPDDVGVNFALGSIALEAGDQADAAARYETVIAAQPRHAGALNNLAWLYSERGDPRALELAQRAHELLPNDPAIADTLGWLHVQRGAAATGLPLLDQATREAPQQAEIRYHYAVALAETGDRARAVDVLTELLAGNPTFPERAEAEQRLAQLRATRD